MVFQELSGPWGRLDQKGVEITPKNVGFYKAINELSDAKMEKW